MTELLQQTLNHIAQHQTQATQDALAAFLKKHLDEIIQLAEKEMSEATNEGSSQNEIDPWEALDIDDIAVDTGIPDFAKNYKHYLYGTPKQP